MSEKRFFVKVYSNNEPFFFDEKQEYVEERYTCEDVRNLHPMEYWQVVELLNEQQKLIEKLRLQEKDKGVPVFVVRDGKNPIALFFNEQRASLYCQENMANLTYQQEKWCRVK